MGATRRIRKYQRGTDTVPAMLTPHEAVLMPIAADLVGRDKIRQANAIGNQIQATLTPQQLDLLQQNRMADAEMRRRLAMNEMPKPIFGFASGTDDVKDLLRETENTFYGGGTAMPQPTPKPTPVPRLYAYGTENVDDTMGSTSYMDTRRNAASRYPRRPGIVNVRPESPVSGSRYLGPNGTDLGPQYDSFGSVNPLPRGAVGVQGDQNAAGFNRSLNGSQPTPGATPSPALTHTQMAVDIARRNLTSAGSSLGASPDDSQLFSPPSGIPRGANATRITGISSETLDNLGITPESYANTDWAKVQEIQNNAEIPQLRSIGGYDQPSPVTPGQSASQSPGVSADELSNAGIRPGRYSDAIGPINRSGTGYSYMGPHGKVDMAGPMHSAAVRAAVERADRNGYGSTYGY